MVEIDHPQVLGYLRLLPFPFTQLVCVIFFYIGNNYITCPMSMQALGIIMPLIADLTITIFWQMAKISVKGARSIVFGVKS